MTVLPSDWIWGCDIFSLILWGFDVESSSSPCSLPLARFSTSWSSFPLSSAQLFSSLDPKTSMINLANHLSGFQDHGIRPWCRRTARWFVTTWDFRKGTRHRDANWNFLCRWIIWWGARIHLGCTLDCLGLGKVKSRRDRPLNFLCIAFFMAIYWPRFHCQQPLADSGREEKIGWGEVDWDRGGDERREGWM